MAKSDPILKQQYINDIQLKARQQQAIQALYGLFGRDESGRQVTQADYDAFLAGQPSGFIPYNQWLQEIDQSGAKSKLQAFDPNLYTTWATHLYGNQNRAYESRLKALADTTTQWDQRFNDVYDDTLAFHTDKLDSDRGRISDAMKAQLIRQGMFGSHLDQQYENDIADSYQRGVATVQGVAASARDKARSAIDSIMNSAVANVNAGNLDAANSSIVSNNAINQINSAYDQATAAQIDNLFSGITDAYEYRRKLKGDTAATQSYFSTPGSSGSINR